MPSLQCSQEKNHPYLGKSYERLMLPHVQDFNHQSLIFVGFEHFTV